MRPNKPATTMWEPISTLWSSPLTNMVRKFYLIGPRLLGGFEGEGLADVCGSLSGAGSEVWRANPEECLALVDRKIGGIVVTMEIAVVCLMGYHVLMVLLRSFTDRLLCRQQPVPVVLMDYGQHPPHTHYPTTKLMIDATAKSS